NPGGIGDGQTFATALVALPKPQWDAINQVRTIPIPGVREILHRTPVIASTTATWSSEKYSPQFSNGATGGTEESALQFDVAIIDEASQLTVPAILGALRLAKRFILVGDEKQLPPLVLSKEAAENGLSDSLFSYLKRLDDDYMNSGSEAESACISLRVQYRMNRWISNFSSRLFYEDKLEAAPTVARRVLAFLPPVATFTHETQAIRQAIQPAFPLLFLDVRNERDSDGQ